MFGIAVGFGSGKYKVIISKDQNRNQRDLFSSEYIFVFGANEAGMLPEFIV